MKVLVDLSIVFSESAIATDAAKFVLSEIPDEPRAYVSSAPYLLIIY